MPRREYTAEIAWTELALQPAQPSDCQIQLTIHSRCLSTTCKHRLSVLNLGVGAALGTGIWCKVDVHTENWKTIVKLFFAYSCCMSSPPSEASHSLPVFVHFYCSKCLSSHTKIQKKEGVMLETNLIIWYLPCETLSWTSSRASKVH